MVSLNIIYNHVYRRTHTSPTLLSLRELPYLLSLMVTEGSNVLSFAKNSSNRSSETNQNSNLAKILERHLKTRF